jgi:flagellar basal-body rod protein FlgB
MEINLDILNTAQSLAGHAATRQSVVARNIANADTPGLKALDVSRFSDSYDNPNDSFGLKSTRHNHLDVGQIPASQSSKNIADDGESAPNGNSVSLEKEMVKSAELKHQYDLALGVYRKSMDILRISLGK